MISFSLFLDVIFFLQIDNHSILFGKFSILLLFWDTNVQNRAKTVYTYESTDDYFAPHLKV